MLPCLAILWILAFKHADGYTNLLFTTSRDIRMMTLGRNNPKSNIIVRDIDEVMGLNYFHERGLLCWSETRREVICCAPFNGTYVGPKFTLVNSHISAIDGIACDWLTGKLYWTDGGTNRIEVVSLDGRHRKVLIWDDIDQPRAIVVVPQKRFMFWTDWGEVPKIERVGMDGSPKSRSVIVNENIFWPNGLAVDLDNELLYWLDGKLKFLAVVDFNGGRRRQVLTKDIEYPYALAYYSNKLYWTDWNSRNIFEITVNATNLPKKIVGSERYLINVCVYGAQMQPSLVTPCSKNNGGCSHLCLLSPDPPGFSCACPTGIKLIDSFTCANRSEEYLIVTQKTDISMISLDSPDYTVFNLPLHGLKHVFTVDYDPVTDEIYWTDDGNPGIRKASVRGSGKKDVVTSDVANPEGVAVDWISRNIFWTDTGTDRVEVSNLKGQFRKVLINKDLVEPRGIAVAPEHGLVFWSDWNEKDPKLERANMDGTDRRRLTEKNLGWPNGIALDRKLEKIFWCDAKIDKIESCSFDGSDRREVISDHINHPFSISLLGDHIFWTDWSQRSLERVNQRTGERKIIAEQLSNIMAVCAVKVGEPLGWNPCAENNGGCNHLCLNKPGNNYICACQIEYELTHDKKTCVRPEAFLLFAKNSVIGSISIEDNNNENNTIPVINLSKPNDLDLEKPNGRIYWTDPGLKAITRAFINGSEEERIVEVGLSSPEGIAVDWMSQNLYWTDPGARRIEVARLNGTSRRVLIWKSVEHPVSIALDPMNGLMYWTDWGSNGLVMRAAMDGKNFRTLAMAVGRAVGITVDPLLKKLYWASPKYGIQVAHFDGTGLETLVPLASTTISSLTYFQDRIYWSDRETGLIESANKATGANRTVIQSGFKDIADILVYFKAESGDNRCAVRNGECEHLCLPLPDKSFTCQCPQHQRLSPNYHTCDHVTSFLIFAQRNSLHRLVVDTDDYPEMELPIQGLKGIRAVEFDPVKNLFYWIDSRTPPTIKAGLETTGKAQNVVQLQEKNLVLHDMVLEPFSRILFWSCSDSDVINATRIDIPNPEVVTIIRNDGYHPRNLAVHSGMGYLVWTDDWKGKGRVVRSRLDGKNITILAKDMRGLSALALDQQTNRIYFAFYRQIDVVSIYGRQRKTLVQDTDAYNLALLGQYLYWAAPKTGAGVERVDKVTGNDRKTILAGINITDLVAVSYPSISMYEQHPCSHLSKPGCSHLCLPILNKEIADQGYYNKTEYFYERDHGKSYHEPSYNNGYELKAECSCPMYQMLKSDGRSCTDMPQCPNQFTCAGSQSSPTGNCVPAEFRCDGQRDCSDGSDERGCPTCAADKFRCLDGECISKDLVCDRVPHCSDGSDEAYCCNVGEFYCRYSTLCISEMHVCDGWNHCGDESDESPELCNHREASTVTYTNGNSTGNYLMIVLVVVFCALAAIGGCYYYRLKPSLLPDALSESAGGLLAPKPVDSASLQTPRTQETGLRMSVFNGSSTSSYDRSHITGASSSSTSKSLSCTPYPAETLNPPPSPVTVRTESRRYCPSAGGSRSYRPYRHYRVINQPPPPTPCETDIGESDYGSVYRPQTESEYMSYSRGTGSECDSDPFPPPPTPSSCPPSPSSTYWNPLPPPPSPVSRHHH